MAQRQILRRLWSARPLFTGLLQHSHHYHASLTTKTVYPLVSNLQKSFSTTAQKNVTFNVQDEADFEERVKKSEIPVIVDFHATWCGPCKILAPRLEKLVAEQEGKVVVAKVDIDDHQDLAIKHGVQAVPTVISFKNGSVVEKFVGVKDEDQLGSFIAKLL